jgi:hypothetical protein
LDRVELPEASRFALAGYRQLLEEVLLELGEVEPWMAENLPVDDAVRRLTTIPGIGLLLAHVIRAEIGQIDRFPNRRHLSSYCGLAPLSDASANRGAGWHRPGGCGRPCCESRHGGASSGRRPGTSRCLAGSRGRSTTQRPS